MMTKHLDCVTRDEHNEIFDTKMEMHEEVDV